MIQAVCWVLIHSLWQGTLLALGAGALLVCGKRWSPALRYRLLCGLLILFLAGMGATLCYEWSIMPVDSSGDAARGIPMAWMSDWCTAHAPQIVMVWLILAIGRSIWMAAGWTYVRRIRRAGLRSVAVWTDRVNEMARQLGIRRTVKLVESALVRVPMVIGQLRPVIFIPLGLINHLPAGEMEAVLMHELAHVRRYDYVVNLVQQLTECVLFFNPGFLWVSSLVRAERENCCDDIAIAHTGNRVEFVRALVRFKEYSLRGTALAFPGNKRQLLHRVLRISRLENKPLTGRERLALLAGTLLLLSLLAIRAGKADMRKLESANGVERVAAPQASPQPRTEPSAELMSVLEARQAVAQKMEWVQSQLDNLHRRGAVVRNQGKPRAAQAWLPMRGADRREAQILLKQRQAELRQTRAGAKLLAQLDQQQKVQISGQQVWQLNETQDGLALAATGSEEAGRDRLQAQRKRELAERDREQAQKDKLQADRDRLQAEIDRQQAARNREVAELDRQQAARNREQAERSRQLAERDRREQIRAQAEKSRLREELNVSTPENN